MRLFIAINFQKEQKDKILQIQSQLKEAALSGNFSLEKNLHLTLLFLGELPETKIGMIQKAMDFLKYPSFTLLFNEIGAFQRNNREIWWVGAEENPILMKMQHQLSDTLSIGGFSIEKRAFTPHLTLAREIQLQEPFVCSVNFIAPVEKISLMKSERIHGKLTYTEIYCKSFGDFV